MIQAYFDQIEALVDKYAVTRFVLDMRISRELRPGEQGYLMELQRHLARWRMRLSQRFPDRTWGGQAIAEARQRSQRVLEMSGLLTEV